MKPPKDKRTKAYKDWKQNFDAQSQGLGDTVEKITKATGIKKLVKWVAGEDCGCDARQERWNKLFPFTSENEETTNQNDTVDTVMLKPKPTPKL